MTFAVSFSVMAHPDRLDQVQALRGRLGRDVPVSWDGEGPASGNADRVWRNARNAWQMHDPSADWHVLLQDDADVCDDFLPGMREALWYAGQRGDPGVVSPYLGRGRYVPQRWARMAESADRQRASFVRTGKLMWGVCIALPVPLISDMITFADARHAVADDMRVAGWAERRRREVWYTWPSLVDHLPVPSLTKHRASDRRAVLHHTGSAMDIDWTGPIVNDPMIARIRPQRSGPSARRRHMIQSSMTRE